MLLKYSLYNLILIVKHFSHRSLMFHENLRNKMSVVRPALAIKWDSLNDKINLPRLVLVLVITKRHSINLVVYIKVIFLAQLIRGLINMAILLA